MMFYLLIFLFLNISNPLFIFILYLIYGHISVCSQLLKVNETSTNASLAPASCAVEKKTDNKKKCCQPRKQLRMETNAKAHFANPTSATPIREL